MSKADGLAGILHFCADHGYNKSQDAALFPFIARLAGC